MPSYCIPMGSDKALNTVVDLPDFLRIAIPVKIDKGYAPPITHNGGAIFSRSRTDDNGGANSQKTSFRLHRATLELTAKANSATAYLPLCRKFGANYRRKPERYGVRGLSRLLAGTGKGAPRLTARPLTRFCAWQFCVQLVAGGATSVASSPITCPMRPPLETRQTDTPPQ